MNNTTTEGLLSVAAANWTKPEPCLDLEVPLGRLGDLTVTWQVQVIARIYYTVLITVAVVGNSAIIVAVRNFFIVTLAVSDTVMALTSGVMTPTTLFVKRWLFGGVLCRLLGAVQGMSFCISGYTLAAIALDRYILIARPTSRPINVTQAKFMSLGIWSLAGAVVSLPVVFRSATKIRNFCGVFCKEKWPNDRFKSIYGIGALVMQFILPLAVTVFCYTSIARIVSKSADFRRKHTHAASAQRGTFLRASIRQSLRPSTSNAQLSRSMNTTCVQVQSNDDSELRRLVNTNRLLIAMVLAFVLAWTPQFTVTVMRDIGIWPKTWGIHFYLAALIAHAGAMISTVSNPIFYGVFNRPVREALIDLCQECCLVQLLHAFWATFRLRQTRRQQQQQANNNNNTQAAGNDNAAAAGIVDGQAAADGTPIRRLSASTYKMTTTVAVAKPTKRQRMYKTNSEKQQENRSRSNNQKNDEPPQDDHLVVPQQQISQV